MEVLQEVRLPIPRQSPPSLKGPPRQLPHAALAHLLATAAVRAMIVAVLQIPSALISCFLRLRASFFWAFRRFTWPEKSGHRKGKESCSSSPAGILEAREQDPQTVLNNSSAV